MGAAAAQVPHRAEGEGGADEVRGRGGLAGGAGFEVHPPLVGGRDARAGQRRAARAGPLVLLEPALQDLDLIHQLGELVVGGGVASFGDAGLGHPAQEEQLPQGQVGGHEQRDEHALLVGRPREPVPEVALRRALVLHRGEVGLELGQQGASPRQRLLRRPHAVTHRGGRSSQGGAVGFLLGRGEDTESVL